MRYPLIAVLLVPFLVAGRCASDRLTAEEAKEAVDEAALSTQALALTGETVEITTSFTIGEALETAAEEISEVILDSLPCADISLDGARLTVVYGALPGNCETHGKTLSGTHIIEVASTAPGELTVNHEWDELSDGTLSVSGTATVTWSSANVSRTVKHQLSWIRLSDNATFTGSGNRVQTPLAGGVEEGIEVNGVRNWTADSGEWDLDIDGVEMRWEDPVPQAGSYTLDTPYDKTLTLTFTRRDSDTIAVDVDAGKQSVTVLVSKSGEITTEN